MVAVMLLLSVTMAFAQQKPNIHILATGGTIAGTGTSATATNYTAGQVAIGTLLDAVPELKNIANVTGEQIVKIGSQDMNDDVWLTLAKKINQLLKRSDIDGIVITHGTDTILMTSLAMIVGLLPLMFASGAGANGNRTLGTSAIGGMLIGMILQIFIVPALFVAFQYLQEKVKPMEWEDVDNSDAEPEIEQYTK